MKERSVIECSPYTRFSNCRLRQLSCEQEDYAPDCVIILWVSKTRCQTNELLRHINTPLVT